MFIIVDKLQHQTSREEKKLSAIKKEKLNDNVDNIRQKVSSKVYGFS